MKDFTTWKREPWILWVATELRLGHEDAVAPLAGGRNTSCHKLSLSCLPASWLTLIQWTSVLSAVVQRAVYPANVQLINLCSWPKIEAVQLSAGLWQGYQHQRPHCFQRSLPSLSFLPLLGFGAVEKRGTVFLFLLLQMANGSRTAFIKTAQTVGAKCFQKMTSPLVYAHRRFAEIRCRKEAAKLLKNYSFPHYYDYWWRSESTEALRNTLAIKDGDYSFHTRFWLIFPAMQFYEHLYLRTNSPFCTYHLTAWSYIFHFVTYWY